MQRPTVKRADSRYKQLRTRNNDSVKKSREKSRREHEEKMESINQLEKDNERLHNTLKAVKKDYEQLRDLLMQHTGIDIDQNPSMESTTTISDMSIPSVQSRETTKEIAPKPMLTINTIDDPSSSNNQLDANKLDGSVVIINGVQYKIVSIEKN